MHILMIDYGPTEMVWQLREAMTARGVTVARNNGYSTVPRDLRADVILVSERGVDQYWGDSPSSIPTELTPEYEHGVDTVLNYLTEHHLSADTARAGIGVLLKSAGSLLAQLMTSRERAGRPLLGEHIRVAVATRDEGWKVLAEKLLGQPASTAP